MARRKARGSGGGWREVMPGKADLEEKFLEASTMCSLSSAQHLPPWIQNGLST